MSLKNKSLFLTVLLSTILAFADLLADKVTERMENSTAVFKELLAAPDQEVPSSLLKKCRGIVIIPGLKEGAFIVGGQHGRGVVSCRSGSGKWSPPGFLTLSGGSLGFQIGVQSTDLVLFIMSERGVKSLLKSKFTLGVDASIAAGPVGRKAAAGVDIKLDADIYAYARTKGLFAGVNVDGSSIREDTEAVKSFYGRKLKASDILFKQKVPQLPSAAIEFIKVLP